MKPTKRISLKEYGGWGQDAREILERHVQKEMIHEWASRSAEPLPKYQEIKVEKNKLGWLNFFRQVLP
jgi:hypothetical protein